MPESGYPQLRMSVRGEMSEAQGLSTALERTMLKARRDTAFYL